MMKTMRTLLYCALCITLCAAIGCDEPKEEPSTPDPPAAPTTPTNPTNPTKPTEPDEPSTPSLITPDGVEHPVTLKSVGMTNGTIALEWESYGYDSSTYYDSDYNRVPNGWTTQKGSTTLLGIKASTKTTVGTISNAVFEEVEIGGNAPIILFGESGYAPDGFAKSVNNVVIQELLLSEGLAVVDDATSNIAAGGNETNKISYALYTAWKALEVHTPPAGDGSDTLNN